ncbi:hypothetical protein [Planctomycetes bacterium K23_9]|uniref:hypothetical protein n=1 Tax=Stieleria marina TaxID=1930275 RepID=UPI0011A3437E
MRSSHSWTEADSAAGFVLRYLSPMQRQLTLLLGSKEHADEALKILLAHLVQAGFGEHKRGRLRDFLVRGVRSCAKARLNDMPEAERAGVDLGSVTLGSKEWLSFWRDCMLERAWRALERHEHKQPDVPVFSVLSVATENPKASSEAVAAKVKEQFQIDLSAVQVDQVLTPARALFAQLIADEIVETLQSPTKNDVKEEIKLLGMAHAFNGVAV